MGIDQQLLLPAYASPDEDHLRIKEMHQAGEPFRNIPDLVFQDAPEDFVSQADFPKDDLPVQTLPACAFRALPHQCGGGGVILVNAPLAAGAERSVRPERKLPQFSGNAPPPVQEPAEDREQEQVEHTRRQGRCAEFHKSLHTDLIPAVSLQTDMSSHMQNNIHRTQLPVPLPSSACQ